MKTILTLVGGGRTDATVLDTAFALGRGLHAHLTCLHARLDAADAILWTPHADYCAGRGLQEAFQQLTVDAIRRAVAGRRHFDAICARDGVGIAAAPAAIPSTTAEWIEENHNAVTNIVRRTRYHDLVIAGRPSGPNGLPRYLIELLLMESGRPVLLAPAQAAPQPEKSVVVFWKDTCEAARALTAAMPVLKIAGKVVLAGVGERPDQGRGSIDALAAQLQWHGVHAVANWMDAESGDVAEALQSIADAHDAGLIVMGGYGHSRLRELILGGCTRHFLEGCRRPVLMMH